MFCLWRPRALDLDSPIREEALDPFQWSSACAFLRYIVREAAVGSYAAIYLFFHERDNYVRSCLWSPEASQKGTWFEHVPMTGEVGARLLRQLRRGARHRRRHHSWVSGLLPYRWQGHMHVLKLESPHDWEVRLFFDDRRPPGPPYTLVFVEMERRKAGSFPQEGS
jgi:hypothetical protein